MKRKYDYVEALKFGTCCLTGNSRRVLRKLVREAVMESWRTTIAAEPSYKDAGVLEDNVRFEAKRIARRLVP